MSSTALVICSFAYLGLLFLIAGWAERRAKKGRSVVANPYVYALSMAIYCTAWTYYGSVGRAAHDAVSFLAIYIGPSLTAVLGWVLLRKMIRICKQQRITSIADFISLRYGKHAFIGGAVAAMSIIGVAPYVALQLKAIGQSASIMMGNNLTSGVELVETPGAALQQHDATLWIALGLALFSMLYGARRAEAALRREGMVAAIAFESVVKLAAFLAVGLYITYGLFGGHGELFSRAAERFDLSGVFTLDSSSEYGEWMGMLLLSMMSVLFLPRQFQVSVLENVNEGHVKTASWLFPLYLFAINWFVVPIAMAGRLMFEGAGVDADTYVLAIPISQGQDALALFAYIGGFSAATSMVIVSTTALSIALSNQLVMPLVSGPRMRGLIGDRLGDLLTFSRRFGIFLILMLAYAYERILGQHNSLVSIGLVSFAAVAQFAPAALGGMFWRGASPAGALAGLLAGFVFWFYTLVLPSMVSAQLLPESWMSEGPGGMTWLRPFALFGVEGMGYILHGTFWSLLFNIGLYVGLSIVFPPGPAVLRQAPLFEDPFQYSAENESAAQWKGRAHAPALQALMAQFLGEAQAAQRLDAFGRRNQLDWRSQELADPRLVEFAERTLAGVIGASSARIMVDSVVKAEEPRMDDVLSMLRESQQVISMNRELRRKSQELSRATHELQAANERLRQVDQLKDEFLYTVTHELRTPLTSIRAFSEILHDNPELSEEERQQFLATIIRETERLTRLITQVLDLEKFESGKETLAMQPIDPAAVLEDAVAAVEQLAREKNARIEVQLSKTLPAVLGDYDRLEQVLINLLSNAIKFCDPQDGHIALMAHADAGRLNVSVGDNGPGIAPEYHAVIFEKFFQAHRQLPRKPKGSGLGLAISKKIVELHGGHIGVESQPGQGAIFSFDLPLLSESSSTQQP